MRRPHALVRGLIGVLLAAPLSADSWLPPREREYASEDGRWRLRVIPGTCPERPRFGSAHSGTHAGAVLHRPDGGALAYPLTAFPTQPCAVSVLDSGDVLAADQYYQRGYGTVLARYDVEGREVWRATLEELLPAGARERATRSTSSLHWLARSWLGEVRSEPGGRRIAELALAWHDRLEVDLDTGASNWIQVTDHGDDAQAWLDRGNSLMTGLIDGERIAEARACYERAIAADPHLVWAWYRLAQSLARDDLDRALEVLAEAERRNPLGEDEDLNPGAAIFQPSPEIQLHVLRARLLGRAGRHAEALAVAEDALARGTRFWAAQHERMRALAALGRAGEALDQAEEAHRDQLRTWNGAPPSDQARHHAALEVGRALREDGLLEASLAHYSRARGVPGYFWDYVERAVGEVLEELGRSAEAAEVARGLLAHYEETAARERGGRFDDLHTRNVERTRAWLARLQTVTGDGRVDGGR